MSKTGSSWVGALALAVALGAQAVSVGSGGQASYGVAISVPPGVAGMSPNLALSYADGGINGPVGVGWSLQGVSTITRCPSSKVIDGPPARTPTDPINRTTVRFDGADRLCLDGQRLIATDEAGKPLVNDNVDAMGGLGDGLVREFRTEKDSFSRIRAYGMAEANNPNSGPAYFKVWTKSGQIYEYGNQSGSLAANARILAQGTDVAGKRRVAVWAVNRISDTLGNYMDFKYEVRSNVAWGSGPTTAGSEGQEWNLKEVQYTGNATSTPVLVPRNKVVFEYEDRSDNNASQPADRSEAYQLGSKNISVRRLSAIRTYINADASVAGGASVGSLLVRSWALSYLPSPISGRSRLSSVRECSDLDHTRCMPSTRFEYSNGSAPSYIASQDFANSPLATKQLTEAAGWRGNITGDFNGDGKTDVIAWSNDPTENELYFSTGNGGFAKQTSFNLKGSQDFLFKQDGCYSSQVMDLNGDGMSDLLRIVKASCQLSVRHRVFLSKGDGTFFEPLTPFNPEISFEDKKSVYTPPQPGAKPCNQPDVPPGPPSGSPGTALPAPGDLDPSPLPTCGSYRSYSTGKRYYLLDVNGDGLIDIINTVFPGFTSETAIRTPLAERCSNPTAFNFLGEVQEPIVCTRIFLNKGDGEFGEHPDGAHPNRHDVLYRDPADPQYQQYAQYNPYWQPVHVFDMDGDGLLDLSANFSGRWRNRGDGSFERWSDGLPSAQSCVMSIDFNGDQRADCLVPALNPADQALYLDDTTKVARFNLTGTADALFAKDGNNVQTTGVVTEDIDGDGRQDILRWSATTANNGVYLSNGDGSFRAIQGAALNLSADPLMTTDGTRTFITGDFLGNGSLQVMLLRQDARPSLSTGWRNIVMPAQSNALLHLSGDRSPIDHLTRVTTGSGVVFQVNGREPITTSSSYTSDRGKPGLAATGQQVDLQPPSYVITSTTKTSPGFEAVQTRYSYHGLKAERNGRGMLGFRETRQQTKAPDGRDLTVVTRNLLSHPYIGVAGVTETFVGPMDLSGQRLSRTTYSYCDKTSQATPSDIESGGTAPVPCPTTDKVQRPYLRQSLEEGWDLDSGIALPTVRTTNSYNNHGDPQVIEVVTRGTALGIDQTFTKKVENGYALPVTDGERWILGRLTTAKVTQSAPNSLPNIATSAGTAPRATARDGSGVFVLGVIEVPTVAPQTLNETVLIQATLRNTSNVAQPIASIAVSSSTGTVFGLQSHGCPANLEPARSCTINISFRPTAVQTFRGSVSARVGSALIEKSLQGDGSPLSVSPTNLGAVAMGSSMARDVAIRNAGSSPLSIQVPGPNSVTGTGFSFESTTCTGTLDPLGTCSVKVRFSPSATGARDGQVTVRTVSGTAASATVSATGINVSISTVDFGFVKPGQSKSASVTVGNYSSLEVTITSGVNLTGSAISIANTSTCTLNKVLRLNESCRIDLVFAPNSVGDYSGNVSLDTSAGNLRSTWTGSAPAWGFDGIQFGRVATREDAVLASTTLYNNGSSPIVFDSPFNFGVAIVPNGTAEFFYAGTTCGAQLDPGANCSVSVSFKPTLTTLQTAELRIRGNSKLMSAAITGTGVAVSLGNLQFGLREPNVSDLGWHAQVQNSSNAAINIGAVTISGNGAFTLFTPTNPLYPPCGSSLGANASCFLGVRYRPTTAGNEQAAEVVVNSSVGGLRSYLSGSTKAWSTAVTFPSTRVGTESSALSATIWNQSGAVLSLPNNIGSLISAPFVYQTTTCGTSLAHGGNCTVSVKFKPTALGSKSSSVSIPTNLGNITMTLSGTGS